TRDSTRAALAPSTSSSTIVSAVADRHTGKFPRHLGHIPIKNSTTRQRAQHRRRLREWNFEREGRRIEPPRRPDSRQPGGASSRLPSIGGALPGHASTTAPHSLASWVLNPRTPALGMLATPRFCIVVSKYNANEAGKQPKPRPVQERQRPLPVRGLGAK